MKIKQEILDEIIPIREERLAIMELMGLDLTYGGSLLMTCHNCYFSGETCDTHDILGVCHPKKNLRDEDDFWTPSDKWLEGKK